MNRGSEASMVSERLRRFTSALPHERESLLQFALRVASELPAGARLIDVGAGDSPYCELFAHLRYESSDWENSVHPGARSVDHVAPAHDLPVDDRAYDAVLCTQVLEHVPNPDAVIVELYRILRPGGRLYMSVPLAWELHEMPFDFYRYTPSSLARMLGDAGFEELDIAPRNSCFRTLAQLLQNVGSTMGRYPDGRDHRRAEAQATLRAMAAHLASFDDLDARLILPLGYTVVACRPAVTDRVTTRAAVPRRADRAAVGLGEARGLVTLCFAADVLNEPSLLTRYAERVDDADDATLVIYAPDSDPGLTGTMLTVLVSELGLGSDGSPDMLALPYAGRAPDERALALGVDAVLSLRPPWGAFTGRPWVHPGNLDTLRARLPQPAGGGGA